MIDREKALEAWKENPEVDDLFTDTGELRLWEDPVGWNGFVREIVDGEPRYSKVNTRFDEDEWISKIRCGERAVRDAVEKHIEDPKAGRAGRFVRRCSPP
jgi:PAB1-binding protein PBP1